MKRFKQVLSILMVCSLLVGILPMTVSAETSDASARSITWNFDDDGTLTISGSGAVGNYTLWEPAPWSRLDVKKLVIEDGITSMGQWAFSYLNNLSSIDFGNGLQVIGVRCFGYCNNLTEVIIPDSVTTIDSYAFNSCSKIERVTFGKGISTIGYAAFNGDSSLVELTIPLNVTRIEGFA